MKNKTNTESATERMQKKERFVTRLIIMISVFIGILTAVLLAGIMGILF